MATASLLPVNHAFLPTKGSKARKIALILLTIAPLFVGLLALALGQDANWDFRNYHWYNAYALVTGRLDIDLLPAQTPSFYNPALDVPFYLLATHVPAKVAGFVLGFVQGLNFVLLFMLAYATLVIPNPKQKVWVCALLAALGLLGGGGIAQIGTTFYDNITSLGLFASALLVLRFWSAMTHRAPWGKTLLIAALCGLPAGVMMGLKLPFVVFCVGLCAALLFITGPLARRIWVAFGFGLGILAGMALALGPWAYYLYDTYGNPLFPYFNDLFGSPYAPPSSGRDVQFIPSSWGDRLLFPFVFAKYPTRVGEIQWQDMRLPVLYALLPLCLALRLLFGRNKNAADRTSQPYAARYLLWTASISYIFWLFMFAIYRYLLPLEMIAPLLIVVVLGFLPVRSGTRALLAVFALCAVALSVQPGNWGRVNGWLDRAVVVTRPDLPNSDKLMILMAGFEPYSHVISAFPPAIPFVRIQSNFASPEQEKGINKLIQNKLSEHKGDFKLLIPGHQTAFARAALGHFNLTFSPQNCQAVVDHLFDSKLILCDVQRTQGTP